jgi:hypothetical protein
MGLLQGRNSLGRDLGFFCRHDEHVLTRQQQNHGQGTDQRLQKLGHVLSLA